MKLCSVEAITSAGCCLPAQPEPLAEQALSVRPVEQASPAEEPHLAPELAVQAPRFVYTRQGQTKQ
jgi:hypothetical protein